jgi:hypothetical protein
LLHRARSSFKKAWNKAQGWLLVPIFGSKSLDRSNLPHASSNVALFSAHAPAVAEKAAASVLIVMVALSGLPSTPSTPVELESDGPRSRQAAAVTKKVTCERDHRSVRVATTSVALPAPETATDAVLGLPETVTSELEGAGRVSYGEDDPNPTQAGGEQPVPPPTAKQTHKKAKEIVVEIIESLDE